MLPNPPPRGFRIGQMVSIMHPVIISEVAPRKHLTWKKKRSELTLSNTEMDNVERE